MSHKRDCEKLLRIHPRLYVKVQLRVLIKKSLHFINFPLLFMSLRRNGKCWAQVADYRFTFHTLRNFSLNWIHFKLFVKIVLLDYLSPFLHFPSLWLRKIPRRKIPQTLEFFFASNWLGIPCDIHSAINLHADDRKSKLLRKWKIFHCRAKQKTGWIPKHTKLIWRT